jgi:hypothetical protein
VWGLIRDGGAQPYRALTEGLDWLGVDVCDTGGQVSSHALMEVEVAFTASSKHKACEATPHPLGQHLRPSAVFAGRNQPSARGTWKRWDARCTTCACYICKNPRFG